MATPNNQLPAQQKPKFSVAITTKGYQSLISNTLRDPARARRLSTRLCRNAMPVRFLPVPCWAKA